MRYRESRHLLSQVLAPLSRQNPNPCPLNFTLHFLSSSSDSSWLSVPGNPLIKWPLPQPTFHPPVSTTVPVLIADLDISSDTKVQNEFSVVASLLSDPKISPGQSLESALDRTGIVPTLPLLEAVFDHFDSSPRLLHSLFLWAERQHGFRPSSTLFSSMINALAKSREFDSAWSLIIHRVREDAEPALITLDVFAILIRRYARAGMHQPAIRAFEFASNITTVGNLNRDNLFEILLDSFCKEGHVRVASEYFDKKVELDPSWEPSIRVYNILLNGWFRSRKLKHAERLWMEIKNKNLRPSVVTYGTLVEGYCRMQRAERAIELVNEMKMEGLEPNAIIYNSIIDALGEARQFKDALGMLERFFVLESGPTISTYNSLVKGFCKAGDLVGASKILKMMINRGFSPSLTTYNYFFKHFSRVGKIEESMNLYNKMIESGYCPDRLTYHLLLKMLCEEERLELAVQVSKEMRARGYDMDLASSTMLVHLLCKMHKLEEAFSEFKDMIRRGIVPQYLTFQRITDELNKCGMTEMACKMRDMMSAVPHSTNLPNTYEGGRDSSSARRNIMRKAQAMSVILKDCNDPRELVKRRNSSENVVSSANKLIDDIKKKANKI